MQVLAALVAMVTTQYFQRLLQQAAAVVARSMVLPVPQIVSVKQADQAADQAQMMVFQAQQLEARPHHRVKVLPVVLDTPIYQHFTMELAAVVLAQLVVMVQYRLVMYRATAVPVDQFQLQVHQLVMAAVVQLEAVEAQLVQQAMAEVRVTTM
jgi:hypothetical protein